MDRREYTLAHVAKLLRREPGRFDNVSGQHGLDLRLFQWPIHNLGLSGWLLHDHVTAGAQAGILLPIRAERVADMSPL